MEELLLTVPEVRPLKRKPQCYACTGGSLWGSGASTGYSVTSKTY
jgi:hypothetical protein